MKLYIYIYILLKWPILEYFKNCYQKLIFENFIFKTIVVSIYETCIYVGYKIFQNAFNVFNYSLVTKSPKKYIFLRIKKKVCKNGSWKQQK